MLLHPSPNCSLRAENLVHVHFKEEIGIAELIPLVTTYIILFAYIYFSTRRSPNELFHDTHFPAVRDGVEPRCRTYLVTTKTRTSFPDRFSGVSEEKTLCESEPPKGTLCP